MLKNFFVESRAKVFFRGFVALDSTKKVFENFFIDILCCLKTLNKISKIEEEEKNILSL